MDDRLSFRSSVAMEVVEVSLLIGSFSSFFTAVSADPMR